MSISSPAVRYTGGKWNLAPWIISQFPAHTCYVEPFCGSGSILFRKPLSVTEVLNDLNQDIVNFFDMLRSRDADLIRAIELTPYSRFELDRANTVDGDALERARRFYIRAQQSFSSSEGDRKHSWRFQLNGKSLVNRWNKTSHLWDCASRLKEVQLECDDALMIIPRFDDPETLMYVDPPYVHSTRSSGKDYKFEMSDPEHVALAQSLNGVQGMVVLSGYDSPLYAELYQGWHKVSLETDTVQKTKRTECLWINDNARKQASQRRLFADWDHS